MQHHPLSRAVLFDRFVPSSVPFRISEETCRIEKHHDKQSLAKAIVKYSIPNSYIEDYGAYTTGKCRQDYLGQIIIELTRPNHIKTPINTVEKITYEEYLQYLTLLEKEKYPKFTPMTHKILRQCRYLTMTHVGNNRPTIMLNRFNHKDYWMDYHAKQKPNRGLLGSIVELLPFMRERRYFYTFTYLILTLG